MKNFDQYSVLLKPVLSTVKECFAHSMPVISTAMHEVMRLPYRYSLLTSKNLPRALGH
jgi:hypothetical protein